MPRAVRPASGARSSALIAGASLLATAANYVFLVAAARLLGADAYGALAALTGLLTLVLLPTGAVQLAVSREVSRQLAENREADAHAFARAMFRLAVIVTGPVVALGLVVAFPLRGLLQIDPLGPVLIAVLGLVAALIFPVALGVLQGHQRFHAVAGLYVLPFALRLVLLALVAAAGLLLGGAVVAVVGGSVLTAVVAVGLLRPQLRQAAHLARPALGTFLRYLVPVVVGLLAVAVLTNVDLLVAKARFEPPLAGDYAAASAFARVAFFLPATILAVLFPRTAARQARGEDTADILGRTLLVTAAFGGLLMLVYAAAGRGLVHTSFGAEFAEGGELLVPLTLCMALYALANTLVGFHLSRAETRYAWILAAAVPLQILALALAPGGLRTLIWVNTAIAATLLVVHEVAVASSAGAVRSGLSRLGRSLAPRRGVVVEAGAAALLAAAFVSVLLWRLVAYIGSGFVGTTGTDPSGTIWWLWHLDRVGYHLFGTTTDPLAAAPFGLEEANGLNLQWLLVYYPAYLLTHLVGEVVAYNAVILMGYALSGLAMYALVRFLGCSRLVAAWAGVVYIVFPAHVARIEHASLTHFEVLPLLVLAVLAAAERQTWTRLALVAVATLAAWLASGYFGAMATGAAVAFAAAAAWVAPRGGRLRLAVGVSGAAVAATAVFGMAALVAGADTGGSLDRQPSDLSKFGLRPMELIVPPRESLLVGDVLAGYHESRTHGSLPSESSNYLGLLTIAAASAWLVVAWRRRRTLPRRHELATVGLASVAAVSIVLAAPSPVGIFGHLWQWTPSRLVFEVLPAFRVPSRWMAMVMTAVLPLAALGLQAIATRLARRSRGRPRGGPLAGAVVVGAILISLAELVADPLHGWGRIGAVPARYEAVARAPAGTLAEYPLHRSDIYAFWQRAHGRPLLNGAPSGTWAGDVTRTLVDPGAPGTAARLGLLGVSVIATRANALDFASGEPRDLPDATWGPGYALLARHADGSSVWRVTAPPAPLLAVLPSPDFWEPAVRADGRVAQALTGKTGSIQMWAKRKGVFRLRFDATSTSEKRWTLHVRGGGSKESVDVVGTTPVSLAVAVPKGFSRLLLTVDPDPEAGEFPLELSAPHATATRAMPQVEAEPIVDRPGVSALD